MCSSFKTDGQLSAKKYTLEDQLQAEQRAATIMSSKSTGQLH